MIDFLYSWFFPFSQIVMKCLPNPEYIHRTSQQSQVNTFHYLEYIKYSQPTMWGQDFPQSSLLPLFPSLCFQLTCSLMLTAILIHNKNNDTSCFQPSCSLLMHFCCLFLLTLGTTISCASSRPSIFIDSLICFLTSVISWLDTWTLVYLHQA